MVNDVDARAARKAAYHRFSHYVVRYSDEPWARDHASLVVLDGGAEGRRGDPAVWSSHHGGSSSSRDATEEEIAMWDALAAPPDDWVEHGD